MQGFRHFLELTLADLTANTQGIQTLSRHKIVSTVAEPTGTFLRINKPANNILFIAKFAGTDNYQTFINFLGVKFRDGQQTMFDADDGYKAINDPKTGQVHNVEMLAVDGENVQVLCTCPDFIRTFAYANANAGALYRTKEAPINIVSGKNTVPGVCKHLLKFKDVLLSRGFLLRSKSDVASLLRQTKRG